MAFVKDGCPYLKCRRCGFLFYRHDPDRAEAPSPARYGHEYWESERAEALRRENVDGFIRAIELIYLSAIRVENILDFGCGLGVTVRLLRDRLGVNAVGVDVTGEFDETDFLHRCDLKELMSKYPRAYFDAIFSIEVFEHLENPGDVLKSLDALLKPGGKILINTGTQEFLRISDPKLAYVDPIGRGHISIYSFESFVTLGAAVGRRASFLGERKYEVILLPPEDPLFPHPENTRLMLKIGEWFPVFMQEYMRLALAERASAPPRAWTMQIFKAASALSPGLVRFLKTMPLLRKAWRKISRY